METSVEKDLKIEQKANNNDGWRAIIGGTLLHLVMTLYIFVNKLKLFKNARL